MSTVAPWRGVPRAGGVLHPQATFDVLAGGDHSGRSECLRHRSAGGLFSTTTKEDAKERGEERRQEKGNSVDRPSCSGGVWYQHERKQPLVIYHTRFSYRNIGPHSIITTPCTVSSKTPSFVRLSAGSLYSSHSQDCSHFLSSFHCYSCTINNGNRSAIYSCFVPSSAYRVCAC